MAGIARMKEAASPEDPTGGSAEHPTSNGTLRVGFLRGAMGDEGNWRTCGERVGRESCG